MDISKIDLDSIGVFDLSYTNAKLIFKAEPINASAKMQRKIRKWIEKTYVNNVNYPENVMQYIGKKVSDEKFFEFIKACHDQAKLNNTHKRELFDKLSAGLNEDVRNTIWALLEFEIQCRNVRKVGADALIELGYSAGYERTLTLVNASCIPEGNIDWLTFENGSLIKQDDGYRLIGEAENYEENILVPISIRFTDAKVDITLYRAEEQLFRETPWMHLESVAGSILSKYTLPGELLNDREKELLPLIAEIAKLSYWKYSPDEFKSADFSHLKSYIIKFGCNELLPLIENLENELLSDRKKSKMIERLNSKLNTQKYESLWRELYKLLTESQAEYPSEAVALCPKELLNETRSNIQRLMEAHGYSGKYPDFVKKGAIRGIHLAESYGVSYFVGGEKNVMYYIHCTEEYFNEHLMIQFLCGTELLKKNEAPGDIYSCIFNAKGRRLFKTVSYDSEYINPFGEHEADDLEQRVQIAVKRAELIKLTKEEKKEIVGPDIYYWLLFLFVFVVMGGLFGIFMTAGLMLVGVIACLIFGQAQAIPSMFTEIPWMALFLLAWGLFGAVMGVITVLGERK